MHAPDMLNNSSREADNTQLYLGYGGGGCSRSLPLLEFVQPKNIKGITLQERAERKVGQFA